MATVKVEEKVGRSRGGDGQWHETKDAAKRRDVDLGATQAVAHMRIAGGTTINTGNFSGVRVDVAIDWPVGVMLDATRETHEAQIEEHYLWLTSKVTELVDREIEIALGPGGKKAADDNDAPV